MSLKLVIACVPANQCGNVDDGDMMIIVMVMMMIMMMTNYEDDEEDDDDDSDRSKTNISLITGQTPGR